MGIFSNDDDNWELDRRIGNLEDKFNYPSLYLDERFNLHIKTKALDGQLEGQLEGYKELSKLREDLMSLAAELGYGWKEGGTWVKSKKK